MMLRIRVTLGLRPLLAGGTGYASERPRDEEVRVFLSHGLSGAQGVTTVPHQLLHRHRDDSDATRYVDVTLVFAPREAAQLARSEQRFWAPHAADDAGVPHNENDGRTVIPPSARLVVSGYVRTYSDAGMVARQPVGSASFLLAQLAGELPHTHADARGAAQNVAEPGVRLALRDDSGDVPLVKGFVTAVAFSVLDERGRASALGAHVRFDARPHTLQRSVFQPATRPRTRHWRAARTPRCTTPLNSPWPCSLCWTAATQMRRRRRWAPRTPRTCAPCTRPSTAPAQARCAAASLARACRA
jgi:hypothetical protein